MLKFIIYIASKGHGLFRHKTIDLIIEFFLKAIVELKIFGNWTSFSQEYIQSYENFEPSRKFLESPENFLESMAIILKSPSDGEKGLILIAYNYAFPTFALIFDLHKIMQKYHIVLEPSTARYLMPEILLFKYLNEKIFIETGEPRDAQFLNRFLNNTQSIPIAANWWIDSRIFNEDSNEPKTYDLIMVSSWLKLKRHKLLFKSLKRLKDRGKLFRCALVGYPIDMTKEDILRLAKRYEVEGLIEVFERIPQKDIPKLYQRSKLNLLLSKREGFNRSVIEGMYCNVPCLIRRNFNFGHNYDYINEKTGSYFLDKQLDTAIERALDNLDKFEPKKWIIDNAMTAKNAALILEKEIFGTTEGKIAMKTSGLRGMEYWNTNDKDNFTSDYHFLLNETLKLDLRKN